MKKKSVKTLALNKKKISDLIKRNSLGGGGLSVNYTCWDSCFICGEKYTEQDNCN